MMGGSAVAPRDRAWGREDDGSVILDVLDMVTIFVAGDGHLKSMLTLTRATVVITAVTLV